jgi:hypothetical protein
MAGLGRSLRTAAVQYRNDDDAHAEVSCLAWDIVERY